MPETLTQHPTVNTTTGEVFARLYGEPLLSIPQELYIPPDALEVFLESFEGPLDLLLYLIRKQNFDVLDIPMALLTEQYLSYVEGLEQSNFELAGEYLLMAAVLIEIKSRMLLPVEKSVDDELDDPRAELVQRLLVYEQIKKGAQHLDEMDYEGRDFWRPWVAAEIEIPDVLPEVCPEDLIRAWQTILQRAELNRDHAVIRETLSVRDHMSQILRRLIPGQFMPFSDLFSSYVRNGAPVAVIVVHFLAVLELAREALIELTQTEPFAPIYIALSTV